MSKILINGLLLNEEFSGVQYYTENLLRALSCPNNKDIRLEVLLSKAYQGQLKPTNNLIIKKLEVNTVNRYKRIFFENFKLGDYHQKSRFQLYHSPSYILPYFWSQPSVLTVHDLITLNYPEFCQTESAVYFRLFLPRSIKKASKIIAVSNKVKNDIINSINVLSEKIEVIYHGIDQNYLLPVTDEELSRTRKKYYLPEKYILFVGNIEPKKNLERLVKAFHILRRNTGITHKLIIAGKRGWKYNGLYEVIHRLQIGKEIRFIGYVPDKDLHGIYKMANVFAFPSLYEGFGIPPLEAMACEVPVLISTDGALPEVTGGNCVQVNAYDVEDIAKGLYRLIVDDNLRGYLVSQGKNWVRRFTWERTARETMRVYEKTLREIRN